jgi:hypothetical protein
MGGSGGGQMGGTIPVYTSSGVRTPSVPPKIQTGELPNAGHKLHRLRRHARARR